MRVLVCGGRDFDDAALLEQTLNDIHSERRISTIIHGAARGADTFAGIWARTRVASGPVLEISCPAHWKLHGKGAGPIRNNYMLTVHKPDLVVAFPGGNGTADMVRRAKAAGVPVREISALWHRAVVP